MNDLSTRKRSDTRERLLEFAEDAILAKGFASTSIEELIAAVGITKSGFFYHFRDKADLAKAILLRYLERDRKLLDDIFARADALNEDPLHGFLVALKLFAEMMANSNTPTRAASQPHSAIRTSCSIARSTNSTPVD